MKSFKNWKVDILGVNIVGVDILGSWHYGSWHSGSWHSGSWILRLTQSSLQNNKGIYNTFCEKKAAILLCTDIAARGLDFPAIHWVVQLNCSQDANTCNHRVGSWRFFVPKIQKWNTLLSVVSFAIVSSISCNQTQDLWCSYIGSQQPSMPTHDEGKKQVCL